MRKILKPLIFPFAITICFICIFVYILLNMLNGPFIDNSLKIILGVLFVIIIGCIIAALVQRVKEEMAKQKDDYSKY